MPRGYRLEGQINREHDQAGDERDQRPRPLNPRPFRLLRWPVPTQDLGVRVGSWPCWDQDVRGQMPLEGRRDLRAALPVVRPDMQPETVAREQRSAAIVPGERGHALGV